MEDEARLVRAMIGSLVWAGILGVCVRAVHRAARGRERRHAMYDLEWPPSLFFGLLLGVGTSAAGELALAMVPRGSGDLLKATIVSTSVLTVCALLSLVLGKVLLGMTWALSRKVTAWILVLPVLLAALVFALILSE